MAIEYRSLFNAAEDNSPKPVGVDAHIAKMQSLRGRFYYGWESPEVCPLSFPSCAPAFYNRLVNTPAFRLILEARGADADFDKANAYTKSYLQVPGALRMQVVHTLDPNSTDRREAQAKIRGGLTEEELQKIEAWERNILDKLEVAKGPTEAEIVCHVVINCNENGPINTFGTVMHAVAHEVIGHVSRHLDIAEQWADSNYAQGLLPFYRNHFDPQLDYENIDHGCLIVNDNFPHADRENKVIRNYLNFRRAYYQNSFGKQHDFAWGEFSNFERKKCEIMAAAGPVFPAGLPDRWRWWGSGGYNMKPVAYDPNNPDRKRFDPSHSPLMQ